MVIWALIITALSVILIACVSIGIEPVYLAIISYLILLVALGILYNIWRRTKSRRMEYLTYELKELHIENDKLARELEECKKSKENL